MTQDSERRKESRASHSWVKQTSASPETEAKEKFSDLGPTRCQQLQFSESDVEQAVSKPTTRSKDRPEYLREDVLLLHVG